MYYCSAQSALWTPQFIPRICKSQWQPTKWPRLFLSRNTLLAPFLNEWQNAIHLLSCAQFGSLLTSNCMLAFPLLWSSSIPWGCFPSIRYCQPCGSEIIRTPTNLGVCVVKSDSPLASQNCSKTVTLVEDLLLTSECHHCLSLMHQWERYRWTGFNRMGSVHVDVDDHRAWAVASREHKGAVKDSN